MEALNTLIDFILNSSRRDDNKEKENLKSEVKELNKRLQMQRNYTTELEAMNHTLEEKNRNLIKVLDVSKKESNQVNFIQKKCFCLRKPQLKLSTAKNVSIP